MVGYYPQNTNNANGVANSVGNTQGTLFYFMLPYIEQGAVQAKIAVPNSLNGNNYSSWWASYGIKTYISPADPSASATGIFDTGSPRYSTSYAPNEMVFNNTPVIQLAQNQDNWFGNTPPYARIPTTFPDGLSNTITFAEKYAACGTGGTGNISNFCWGETGGSCNRGGGVGGGGSVPSFNTLQVPQNKPIYFTNCDPCRLQAFYAGGINVGLGDGSVRLVNSGITPATWGNAIQPADGVPLGSDW
jgi:Protein of unknown function (DUF1559)